MNPATIGEAASRKRGRPPGDPAPKKRKQAPTTARGQHTMPSPAAVATFVGGHQIPTADMEALGRQYQHPLAVNSATGQPAFVQQAFYSDAYKGMANEGYAVPSVAAMQNAAVFRDQIFAYDYGSQMYGFRNLGDNINEGSEGVSSAGLGPPQSPFVMPSSAVLQAPQPGVAYLPYMGETYLANYNTHLGAPQMAALSPRKGEPQVHGLVRGPASPMFFDPSTGQVVGPQFAMQMMAPDPAHAMGQHVPIMLAPNDHGPDGLHGSQPLATLRLVGAASHATPRIGNVSTAHLGGPVPRSSTTHAQSPLCESTPFAAPIPGHVLSSPKVGSPHPADAPTPKAQSVSLAVANLAATPRPSSRALQAPTPRTSIASPNNRTATPPPPTSTPLRPSSPGPGRAPTPFGSASSELSSLPPESPMEKTARIIPLPVRTADPSLVHGSTNTLSSGTPKGALVGRQCATHAKGLCVSSTAFQSTAAQLELMTRKYQALEHDISHLAPPHRAPGEDMIISIAKCIMDAEARCSAHESNEELLRNTLDEMVAAKGKLEAKVTRIEEQLAKAQRKVDGTGDGMVQLRQDRASFEARLATQREEIAKVNLFVQQIMERNTQLEQTKSFQVGQLLLKTREVNDLRTELAIAHDKVARLVAVRGISLEEVSPIHVSPPLERTNSFSVPPTPIYTPTQPAPMEALPTPSMLFSPHSSEIATIDCDSITGKEDTTSVLIRSSAFPSRSTDKAATPHAAFTPRVCQAPHDSIGATAAALADSSVAPNDAGSPWKNWLQLENTSQLQN